MPALALDTREAMKTWLLTSGDAKFVLLDFVRDATSGSDLERRRIALKLIQLAAEVTGQFHGRWREDWAKMASATELDAPDQGQVTDDDLLTLLTDTFGADLDQPAHRGRDQRPRIGVLPFCSELAEANKPYLTAQDSALFRVVDELKMRKVDRMFAH